MKKIINELNGPTAMTYELTLGPNDGNSTLTEIILNSQCDAFEEPIIIKTLGTLEREDLINLFKNLINDLENNNK